jgi:hypothetical protein
MVHVCPRCQQDEISSRGFCPTCGLRAEGVHPDSRTGTEARHVERAWLTQPGNEHRAQLHVAGGVPPPVKPPAASTDTQTPLVEIAVRVLGGAGWAAVADQRMRATFRESRLDLGLRWSDPAWTVNYRDVAGLEMDDPATIIGRGGLTGGGFSRDAMRFGITVASVVKIVSSSRQAHSLLRVHAKHGERSSSLKACRCSTCA